MADEQNPAGGSGTTDTGAGAGTSNAANGGETPANSTTTSQTGESGAQGGTPASSAQGGNAQGGAPAGGAAAPTVPDKYDLKAPEGVTLDAAVLEATTTKAKSLGYSQEQAQGLLDFTAEQVKAARTAARDEALADYKVGGAEWVKQASSWETAALADPDIGGTQEKLDANVALAQKVFGTFGDQTIHNFLRETGFGSHPAVIKMFSKIGRSMSEGSLVQGDPVMGGQGKKDPATTLYGNTPNNAKTS